jgi:hypothetical protein
MIRLIDYSFGKRRRNMFRVSTFATALALCLGTTAVLNNSKSSLTPGRNVEASFASDGAFRDGLYLGKLTAESGQPFRPGIGRWSLKQDRIMFTAGYRRGYRDVLANARTNGERGRAGE